jgi:acyl-coenzyme A synthetase/AMP-(fatty) acid ligase
MVCRFANGLRSLGVVKGDRIVIYMPLTIEGAVAMLACAREPPGKSSSATPSSKCSPPHRAQNVHALWRCLPRRARLSHTVWRDPARYELDWQFFPGCYVIGDVAMKDKDGYIAVLGRSDDVLNVAGHHIGTAEVESALVSHPAVAEAADIGVPDPLKGECIEAFVQVRIDQVPSEALAAALIEHVRRALSPLATPSSLEFVASLPKTRSGKILPRLLKAKEAGVDAGDVSTMEG